MADPIPLWRQLQVTAQLLFALRGGRSLQATLPEVEPALRPGVQALVFHVLRWLGTAQALRDRLVRHPPAAAVDALLCSALALLAGEDPPYDPHTVVNQCVEAAKQDPRTREQAAFLNACLRRYLREHEALRRAIAGDLCARWNHPAWWIARLRADYPTHWQDILRADNARAPLVLRVNTRCVSRDAYLQTLADAGIEALPIGDQGVRLREPQPVHSLPGFEEGHFAVQDAAAQRAAPLVLEGLPQDRPLRVLDACAAPGGKTAHLLELLSGSVVGHTVTALDISEARCARIRENLTRLRLQDGADVRCADAADLASWWDGRPFDAVLLDAPCTASGIVRRHPDVRWLRRESDVAQLAEQAGALLSALWPVLRPGGQLLFCVCSVFKAEGEGTVEAFVAHNKDARRRPSPGHLVPQTRAWDELFRDNPDRDQDGFYYALLGKDEIGHGSSDQPAPA